MSPCFPGWAPLYFWNPVRFCIFLDISYLVKYWASLGAQQWRICWPMQEIWVWSLGREAPRVEEMATHSSVESPWAEEPGRLLFMGRKESGTTERLNHINNSCIKICQGSLGRSAMYISAFWLDLIMWCVRWLYSGQCRPISFSLIFVFKVSMLDVCGYSEACAA